MQDKTEVRRAEPKRANPFLGSVSVGLGLLGVVAFGLSLVAVQPFQFKVVGYATALFERDRPWTPTLFAAFVLVAILLLAVWVRCTSDSTATARRGSVLAKLWPLLLSSPLAAFALMDKTPPFYLSFFVILAGGWTAFQLASHATSWPTIRRSHAFALATVVILIVVLTIVHTRIQLRFFEHLMFGHADIGHFAEELKNALAGRGLRSDSFDNTRFGWHFVPLMYLLVPGYAVWPSPVYLMVVNALIVHVVALPAYYLARRLSGSALIGLIWAVAWLLLPSLSRLVYANSYGFQWNNATMPIIAIMIAAGVTQRHRTCIVMTLLLLLCRETAAPAAAGWGVYLLLFTSWRKTGACIALGSVAYFAVCVGLVIPYFAQSGSYERLSMFGELGGSFGELVRAPFSRADVFWSRLLRPQVGYFTMMLLVPMALVPVQGWRLLLAVIPTFLLLALVENTDWLSIKFWHQASILPFVFFAAILAMQDRRTVSQAKQQAATESGRSTASPGQRFNIGVAAAVLCSAALGHYFFGFSPISKSYEPHAASEFLQRPDPRLDRVNRLRLEIPTDRTILATERLAAHFTDYKRLYTGRRIRPVDFVIIDRADYWDTSGLPDAAGDFADDPDYTVYGEFGSVIVFERHPDAPPVAAD